MAKTFEQIRDEAMEYARKNGLDEVEAQKYLRRKLRNAGVALPPDMATEEEFKQQMKETEEKKAKMSDRERKLLEKVRAYMSVQREFCLCIYCYSSRVKSLPLFGLLRRLGLGLLLFCFQLFLALLLLLLLAHG